MKFSGSLLLVLFFSVAASAQYQKPKPPVAKQLAADKKASAKGDVAAMASLGTYSYYGVGMPQNYTVARQWYTKAADKNDVNAMLMLADIYGEGEGVTKDSKLALDWYKKAATNGNVDAAYDIGLMYEEGDGVAVNMQEAVKWYQLAAQKGNVDAMMALGFCFMEGDGVPMDKKQGYDWFLKAVNAGVPEAMRYLGDYYAQADMGNDCSQAADWYMKAADAGDSLSLKAAGIIALKGDCLTLDKEKVATWMKAKADANNAEACFYMGGFYIEGIGVRKSAGKGMEMLIRDRELGHYTGFKRNFSTNNLFTLYNSGTLNESQQKRLFDWFQTMALSSNDDEMMAVVANIFINKENAAGNDYRAGLDWAMKSAEKGNPGGCFWVGFIYSKGLGDIKKDDIKAFSWLLKAAQKGDKDAMRMVSACYEKGTGTAKNPAKAAHWKAKAELETQE